MLRRNMIPVGLAFGPKQWVSLWTTQGVPFMDRRTVLASLGAVVAASPLKAQEPAQSPPRWSSPVIDMHFHMRASPALNVAHQQGAGATAANLLTPGDAG